jgi:transposase
MRAEMQLDLFVAEKVGIGSKNRILTGSQRGRKSMAIALPLMETAKLNKVDPQAWLTWVLKRIAGH